MRRFVFTRPLRLLVFPVAVALASGAGCGADSSDGTPAGEYLPLPDGGKQNTVHLDSSTPDSSKQTTPPTNPLCGSVGFCPPGKIPDDPLACADYVEPTPPPPGRDGGRHEDDFDASATGDDARAPDGGGVAEPDAAVPPQPDAGTAPAEAGAPAADARAEGGYRPPSTVPENPSGPRGAPYACQVRSDSNGNPSQDCFRSGSGDDGAPCSSTNDCRAGLACVGEAGVGECRPYCCALGGSPCGDVPDGSAASRFCGERPLLEPGKAAATLRVPVCVPAEGCELTLEPCLGSNCCPQPDEVCTVVSDTGTTGCKKPGTGKVGNPCPCALGYLCSAQDQCVKLCKLDGAASDCAPGKCAAVVGVPPRWGVCVGLTATLK